MTSRFLMSSSGAGRAVAKRKAVKRMVMRVVFIVCGVLVADRLL